MGGNKEGKATKNWTERFRTFVKENKFLLILEAVFIAFHTFFEDVYFDFFEVFFESFSSNLLTFLLFIGVLSFIFFDGYKKVKDKYRQSPSYLFHLGFIGIVYIYYRYTLDLGEFEPIINSKWFIVYADIIFLFIASRFIILGIIWNIRRKNKGEPKNNITAGFVTDNPIKKTDDDSLGRKGFARNIANKLIATESKDSSFAVGINGDWGSGKTSFLTLIEKNLIETNSIIIYFDPWLNQGKDSIIRDFFGVFNEEIKKFINITSPLKVYVDLLKEDSGGYFGKYIGLVEGVFFPKRNIKAQYEEINKKIKKLNKKIYIFIDDIDRLSKEEVVEVIKLIRNTANFSNTYFIVAYDKNYVIEAIKSYNDYEPDKFLEKIFQVEFSLPMYEKEIRIDILFEKLKERGVDRRSLSLLYNKIMQNSLSIEKFLVNLRDINRFVNSFLPVYTSIQQRSQNSILIEELFFLEILRLFISDVYNDLYRNKYIFLHTINYKGKNTYQLISNINIFEPIKNCYNKRNLSISKSEISNISRLLQVIFEKKSIYKPELSVTIPSNFERYFYFRLNEYDISIFEFSSKRKSIYLKFISWIEKQIENNKTKSLLALYTYIKEYDDIEDYIKIIETGFYLAFKITDDSFLKEDLLFDLLNKLSNKNIFNFPKEDQKTIKEEIKRIFIEKQKIAKFKTRLLYNILVNNEEIVLSKEEQREIKKELFEQYIKDLDQKIPTNDFLNILEWCSVTYNAKESFKSDEVIQRDEEILDIGYMYIRDYALGWFLKEVAFRVVLNRDNNKMYYYNYDRYYHKFLKRIFAESKEIDFECFSEFRRMYESLSKNSKKQNFKFTSSCEPSLTPDSSDQGIS